MNALRVVPPTGNPLRYHGDVFAQVVHGHALVTVIELERAAGRGA